ncbi:MAG: hypothetical protein JSS02_33655 [Planctomycetes bacterium]|nr:hypothetical protein [Planctomycetota bacterium]
MKRRAILVIISLIVLLTGGVAVHSYSQRQNDSYRLIQRGARSSFGNATMSGGNAFFVSGKPAVLFGTVTKPNSPEQFSYILVFRNAVSVKELAELGAPGAGLDAGVTGSGTRQISHSAITIRGQRLEARHVIEWNKDFTEVTSEKLTVGGQERDLAAGNVFLVDLTGPEPVSVQKKIAGLPVFGPRDTFPDVEKMSEEILLRLSQADDETKKFVK